MILINPSGKGVRSDGFGNGHFGATRRTKGQRRKHKGTDYIVVPGQRIFAPADAIYRRIAYPYADSRELSGGYFEGEDISYKIFYYKPTLKPGTQVRQGDTIGYAQDISNRYGLDRDGNKMVPHIHLEITKINPEILTGGERT